MPLISWGEYAEMIARVADGSWRVIGWGAGIGFSFFNRNVALRHDYLVDSDPAKWGTYRDGYAVRSPRSIAAEDPERTIIIIYNYKDHGKAILRSLQELGPYKAIMNFHPFVLRTFSQRLSAGIDLRLTRKEPAVSGMGFIVQGPLEEGVTEWIVRYYASSYPKDWLIVSTWADSPPHLVERIRPYCDRLLLNDGPGYIGLGNRNNQLQSTRAGLDEASRLGLQSVIKTRTNSLITGEDIFRRSIALRDVFSAETCRTYGLRNRIIVSERITMKYIPYHISDVVLFGDVADLALFFAAPHDMRKLSYETWQTESFGSIARNAEMTEIYFAVNFLRKIGWNIQGTLEDHWSVVRDLFIVHDERWFGHFIPRYDVTMLDDDRGAMHANKYIDFNFWMRLYAGLLDRSDYDKIDLDAIRLVDIYDVHYHNRPLPVNADERRRIT